MKNTHILVPIDFSERSIRSLKTAQEVVSMFGGTITPFHAIMKIWQGEGFYHPISVNMPIIDYHIIQDNAITRLNEIASRHVDKQYLQPSLVKIGDPAKTILESAADFDMVVMSSHGRSGFTRIMMGSVAEEVLRFSKFPVLIVKEKSSLAPLKKILVTTDFSDSSLTAFPWALAIAKATDADIELATVIRLGPYLEAGTSQITDHYKLYYIEESKNNMEILINDYFYEIPDRVNSRVITTHVSIHEALYTLIKNNHYDMIVMTSLGHTGLKFLLLGSTTANVVRHAEPPVLVIHPT